MISSLFAKVGVRPAWLLATCLLALGLLLPPGQAGAESGEPGNGNGNGNGCTISDCDCELDPEDFEDEEEYQKELEKLRKKVCKAFKEGKDYEELGTVVCCEDNGSFRRFACAYIENLPPDMDPGENEADCREEIEKCILKHEQSHIDDNLGACELALEVDDDLFQQSVGFHDASDEQACAVQATECVALQAELKCIQALIDAGYGSSVCQEALGNVKGNIKELMHWQKYGCGNLEDSCDEVGFLLCTWGEYNTDISIGWSFPHVLCCCCDAERGELSRTYCWQEIYHEVHEKPPQ